MLMFNRGEFDRLITIYQTSGASRDAFGEPTDGTATSVTTRWAKKRSTGSGDETIQADREAPITTDQWMFDYVSGLTESMWIEDRDGVAYDIVVIDEVERKRYHIVKCKRRN